jgi:membrane dipeptidase
MRPDTLSISERARQLHADSLVWVMHCHVPLADDLERTRAGGVTGKVLNLVVDVDIGPDIRATGQQQEGWAKKALIALDQLHRDIDASGEHAVIVTTAAEIEQAKREGKTGILIGVEGGKLLEGDLALLRMFYRMGLRELQLAWAVPNLLKDENGLTPFGRDAVREMNRLGMIIDLTHIPRRAFDDVVALSTQPVIISHGGARGVNDKDLGDEEIRAIAGTGGMVGIHFYITYMFRRRADGSRDEDITVEDVVDHISYVRDLVGIDHVGLGVDFFPTDPPWTAMQQAQGTPTLKWVIDGMHQMPLITDALVRRGYSDEEIRKVLGLNFLRVCRTIFGA